MGKPGNLLAASGVHAEDVVVDDRQGRDVLVKSVRRFTALNLALVVGLLFFAAGPTAAGDLKLAGRVLVGPADWIATDGLDGAFGSGQHLIRTRGIESPVVVGEQDLTVSVRDAVLVGPDLYVNDGHALRRINLDRVRSLGETIVLDPSPIGNLLTARMTDYIVVSEDGFGLRIIELPASAAMIAAMGDGHHGSRVPTQIASVPISLTFRALATAGKRVYAGTAENTVIAIDIENIAEPRIRVIPTLQEIHAIAANGARLYVLGPQGLRLWDINDLDAPNEIAFIPEVEGRAVRLLGRTLQIASGEAGMQMIFDASSAAGGTQVVVGTNFFSPQHITISPGDEVTWTKTTGFHNVESCPAAGGTGGCSGLSATQAFRSGDATFDSFTYAATFTRPGTHDYICVIHSTLGMVGSVTVSDAPPAPPVVPDGQTGQPVTVNRADPTGNLLQMTFDPATCSSTDHQIVFGGGSGLPQTVGGAFATLGSTCAIGSGPNFEWDSPATSLDRGGLLWWLVLATDGAGSEGSWGLDASGSERNGADASNECNVTKKNLENSCGQ